ncbi:hypothetical protein [Agrobacterium cavarae]|uniref:hypothetical protein n=1 Tax=Agrobacterium cavarae TaxID=2528239 RepID=UPI002FF52ACC
MTDDKEKDEQKTERFNMFMSPSEMKAIEDWAWENRIRSKSEAVRRLCQIGLVCEVPTVTAGEAIHDLLEKVRLHHNANVMLQNKVRKTDDIELYAELEAIAQSSQELHEQMEVLQVLMVSTYNQLAEVTSDDPLDDGLDAARDWKEKAAQHIKKIARKHSRRKK